MDKFIDMTTFFRRVQTACAGKDTDQVARQVQVPKDTVERWLDERYAPHPKQRVAVLEALEKR